MGTRTNSFSQMVWFIGVIENIVDPQEVNRVQVRCIDYHTADRSLLSTEKLPWATFAQTSARMSAPMVLPGDWTVGFFLDGENAQQPIILAVLDGIPIKQNSAVGFTDPSGVYPKEPGKPTTSPLARNDLSGSDPISYGNKTVSSGVPSADHSNWSEPASPYNAKYPFNHVIHTDGNNIIELDDTSGSERIRIFHPSGSFTEVHPDGSVVHRDVGSKYQITAGNNNIVVGGACNLTVTGDLNLLAGGKVTIGGSDLVFTASNSVKVTSGSDMDISVDGELREQGSLVSIKASSAFNVDANEISIESGESVSAEAAESPPSVPTISIPKFNKSS